MSVGMEGLWLMLFRRNVCFYFYVFRLRGDSVLVGHYWRVIFGKLALALACEMGVPFYVAVWDAR